MTGKVVHFPDERLPPIMEIICRLVSVDGLGPSLMLTVPRKDLDIQAQVGTTINIRKDGAEFEARIISLKPVWSET